MVLDDPEPSRIWPAMENLHVPAIKKRHLNMPPSEIMNEIGIHAWKAFQGTLSYSSIMNEVMNKIEKEKEALFQHLNETVHNLKAEEAKATRLQAKVAELEEALAKMNETHRDIGAYFSWKSRIEMMEEFANGEHSSWNLEKTKAEFLATFPPEAGIPGAEFMENSILSPALNGERFDGGDKTRQDAAQAVSKDAATDAVVKTNNFYFDGYSYIAKGSV